MRIGDKFHIVQRALESIVDIRSRCKQTELTNQREIIEAYEKREREYKASAKKNGVKYKKGKRPKPKKYSNGETLLELMSRSNRALTQFCVKWGKEMNQRIKLLFEALPDIKEAYKIVSIFRGIYSLKNFGEQTYQRARKALHKWYATIGNINIVEIKNLAHSIKRHEPQMLAFFFEGFTNAFAESLNAKLQRLIQCNYGIRNQDLFLFRVNKNFT